MQLLLFSKFLLRVLYCACLAFKHLTISLWGSPRNWGKKMPLVDLWILALRFLGCLSNRFELLLDDLNFFINHNHYHQSPLVNGNLPNLTNSFASQPNTNPFVLSFSVKKQFYQMKKESKNKTLLKFPSMKFKYLLALAKHGVKHKKFLVYIPHQFQLPCHGLINHLGFLLSTLQQLENEDVFELWCKMVHTLDGCFSLGCLSGQDHCCWRVWGLAFWLQLHWLGYPKQSLLHQWQTGSVSITNPWLAKLYGTGIHYKVMVFMSHWIFWFCSIQVWSTKQLNLCLQRLLAAIPMELYRMWLEQRGAVGKHDARRWRRLWGCAGPVEALLLHQWW